MATHLPILLILAFACLFSCFNAEITYFGHHPRRQKIDYNHHSAQHPTIRKINGNKQAIRFQNGNPHSKVLARRRWLAGGMRELESDKVQGKEKFRANGVDSGNVDTSKPPRSSEISSSINDDMQATIEERISAWTFLPKENSEPFQFLHFGLEDAKEKYDYVGNKSKMALNEPLMATFVLYLSNVSQGGQIIFPELELENSQLKNGIWSDCRKINYELRPTRGNAILFFNTHLNASPDPSSRHGRCPVLEGEMWCATKFFRVRAVTKEKVPLQLEDGDCTDEDEKCARWAAVGECQRNPIFMIGSPDYYGTCRKSCNAC